MGRLLAFSWVVVCLPWASALAHPYFDASAVPKDTEPSYADPMAISAPVPLAVIDADGVPVVRVDVAWDASREGYRIAWSGIERSGTPALLERAKHPTTLGSYRAVLLDSSTQQPVAYDSTGTGSEFRKLTLGMTFRFPVPDQTVNFRLEAEDPQTGAMKTVLVAPVDPKALKTRAASVDGLEVRILNQATAQPPLVVNFYAEGYGTDEKASFFQAAQRAASVLEQNKFPGVEHMELRAVFAPSEQYAGAPRNLGYPVPEVRSFLSLYYPYWDHDFTRWYDTLYPTREKHFRDAVGSVPYDYPVALVNSSGYFGTGNFNEVTVVPAANSSFSYLLQHEFGHYFGLNEEYDEGGTELLFSPAVTEPWSQNQTFLTASFKMKWMDLVQPGLPLPTPAGYWQGNGPFGAYEGGYGGVDSRNHKPGYDCIMDRSRHFCPICRRAISAKVDYDTGR